MDCGLQPGNRRLVWWGVVDRNHCLFPRSLPALARRERAYHNYCLIRLAGGQDLEVGDLPVVRFDGGGGGGVVGAMVPRAFAGGGLISMPNPP